MKKQGEDYLIGSTVAGTRGSIDGLRWRPDISWDIFFHTHPNRHASGRISERDLRIAAANAVVIAYGHGANFYKYDGR